MFHVIFAYHLFQHLKTFLERHFQAVTTSCRQTAVTSWQGFPTADLFDTGKQKLVSPYDIEATEKFPGEPFSNSLFPVKTTCRQTGVTGWQGFLVADVFDTFVQKLVSRYDTEAPDNVPGEAVSSNIFSVTTTCRQTAVTGWQGFPLADLFDTNVQKLV
ncbi:hypothetical protein AVEN_105143-1 [Araneus ventricosus]|uniref:Uncharacterized protein n=1 Tax=Araneus ventricosus TaxID=182803 RepID=A0A4Y2VDA4_ARAVE|nr:hypothetical protein AVEN_131433-1 [Araneus ventricosus]GBO21707.1 hypothetical protein AVEN_105143-1 [Araneus ventricosus]